MHITSGTMTTVLDTLERNSYIRRLADPDDRRRVLVDITPAAQAVLDQTLPEVQQLAKAIMGVLDDDALNRLLATLATLTEALQNSPQNLPPPAPRRTPGKLRRE
jgi:DNA-binding MarR family transcriptional regulator